MLKGTMKIELTDVYSGETETVLEQNMVTNALSEIFKPLGLSKSSDKMLNSYAPYYQTLLGGLLLFDSAIDENEEQLFPNADNRLIGCGVYGEQNNTTGTSRGGYNQTESELNMKERFMKYVYDFTTSQANGTIASVCLTHKNGGYTSYGSNNAITGTDTSIMKSVCASTLQYVYPNYTGATTVDKYAGVGAITNENIFAIDRENDVVLYFRKDSSTSISIIKRRAYLKSISIFENPRTEKALVEEVTLDTISTPLESGYYTYNYDPKGNVLYIFFASKSTTVVGGTILVTKILLSNWNITQYTITNTTEETLRTSGYCFAFAHNGYVYIKGYASPYNIYKMQISNNANVVKLKMNGITTVTGYPQLAINGRIFYEDASSSPYTVLVANESTNEISITENNYLYSNGGYGYFFTPVLNEPMLYYASHGPHSGEAFCMMVNYLATINNLTEPVTKTADKTMKITYIIQEQ